MNNQSFERILITGVSGFLGRTAARHFSQQGISVFGTDRSAAENAPLMDLRSYVSLTLPDPRLETLLKEWQPQAVIHCAGRASVLHSMQNPAEDYQNGPALTFFLLDTIRRVLPDCKFVLLSSAAVYGNPIRLPMKEEDLPAPISAYGFHKWQSEIICREFATLFQMKTASARVFSAYGPGLRRQVIWDLVQKALTQKEIILQGTGREGRDFIHAHDVARALGAVLLSSPMEGEVYNVASGEQTNISTLASMLLTALNLDIPIRATGVSHAGVPVNWQADISKLTALGYTQQVRMSDGLASVAAWCRSELTL